MKFLFKYLILPAIANALALFVVQYFLKGNGFEITRGIYGFLMVGLIFGILNATIRPTLKILSFPLKFLTMGLSFVLINVLILFCVEYFFNTLFFQTFQIHFSVGNGVVSYLLAAILLSFVNTLTHLVLVRR